MKRPRDYSEDYHSLLSQFPREEVVPALDYVKELKTCFQYDQPEEKLRSFSRILEDVIDTKAVYDSSVRRMEDVPQYFSARVKAILEGNRDLICGFNSLMPPLYQISIDNEEKKHPEAAMESNKTNADRETMDFVKKMTSKCGQDGCEELLKIFSSYKEGSKSFYDVSDFGCKLTKNHPDLLQDFLNFMPTTEAIPLAFSLPDMQSSYPANCRVDEPQKRSCESIKVCQKNKESDVVMAGTSLQDEEKKIEETTESKKVRYREGMDFVNKLKIKCGEDGCNQFLEIFNLFKEGSRTLVDVYHFGLTLTEGHPDLQKEFIKFMPPLSEDREVLGFFEKVEKRLSCKVIYKTFLKIFFYYRKGKFGKAELEKMVTDLIGKYPDLIAEFYRFWWNCESVDVCEATRCEERDRRRGKQRNESRRLDCSFMRRNPNQTKKKWFEYEDELYHLDMTVEWFKSAVAYAEELGGSNVKDEGTTGNGRIFLRCIEYLYDDQGIEVLHIFYKNPQRSLPVLRKRLRQKLQEVIQYRNHLN